MTNIPLFFKHLRENIHSIYDKQRDSAAANNDETEGAAQRKEEDVDKASETRDIKIATPTRRGYSSNSQPEPSPLPDNHLDAADITSRDYRASNLYTLGRCIEKYMCLFYSLIHRVDVAQVMLFN